MGGSASVSMQEVDLSASSKGDSAVVGGIVIQASMGEIGVPTLCSSEEEFTAKYGMPDPKKGWGHYSAIAYLNVAGGLIVNRVANGALYGGAIVGSKDATAVSTPLTVGVASLTAFEFTDDDKEALLITGATQGIPNNAISYSIMPSNDYKNAYIIKVFQDTTAGRELKETWEASRLSQKNDKGEQMQISELINNQSSLIKVVENLANVNSSALAEGLFVDTMYDFHLYKETYTLKTGETLKNAVTKTTPLGSIVFDNGYFWEYIGSTTKVADYVITPSVFTAEATAEDWKLLVGRGENLTYLTKGSDGSAVTIGNFITGLDAMKNPEEYDIKIFMDGGIVSHPYHTALVEMTKNRINSFAVLSADPTAEKASSNRAMKVVNYRKEGLINSSYGAMYSPHVKIYDKYNDIYVEASPDGFVAGAIASNAEVFFPTAGWESGVIAVNGLTAVYNKEERDLLYDNGVNPIRQSSKKGTAIWGNKTLLTRASSLDRVNVRFAMIILEPKVMDFLDNFEFKINNQITRLLITTGADGICKDLKSRGAFYDYYVVCDNENNTETRIQQNELWCDVYVKPSISAEFIKFRAIVTTTGADFMAVKLS